VFEFLDDATVDSAFPAGHHAIQLIRQWAAGAVRAGQKGSFEGLAPAEADLAKRIVAEIEAQAGKPAGEIPEAMVEEYIVLVSDRLQQLSRKNFQTDSGRGKSLLNKLRSIR
jgi:hypothetical protein